MVGFNSPFGADDDRFDTYEQFVREHVPEPGPFLEGHRVLTDDEHVAFHDLTRSLFEERTVYDVTFGYNLARLNLDANHPDAGYRYARQRDAPSVLRAEFTPTTAFCPQARTLAVASFRAWNGLADRHEYDFVRVRVAPNHHQSDAINEFLDASERRFRETGELDDSLDVDAESPGGSNALATSSRSESRE